MKKVFVILLSFVAVVIFTNRPVKCLTFESLINEIIITSPLPKPERAEKDKLPEVITYTQAIELPVYQPTMTRPFRAFHLHRR